MDYYWKAIACAIVSALLGLHMGKQEKELNLLLILAACCMAGTAALTFLQPLIAFLRQMQDMLQTQSDILQTLLKATAIALVTDMAASVCQDAGSGALGKTVSLLGSAVLSYLSLPLVTELLELIQEILGVV